MQLGMIGLGRMGANMVRRLMKGGHACAVFDRSAQSVAALAQEGATRRGLAGRPGGPARQAARAVADGAGRGGGLDHRRAAAAAGAGRHADRRRQFLLRRRHPPRQGAGGEADRLCRRRHQRRRVGPGARLLHDDRRPGGDGAAPRPDLRHAGPGHRQDRAHARPRGRPRHRRTGLPALRRERRRPLRQDGPQRHRVRHHGRVRRRHGHPEERQRRQARACRRCRDHAAARPRALPVRPRPARHRRALAPRQRDLVLAARPDGRGAGGGPGAGQASPAGSPTPAKAAGPSRPPSTRPCPRRC